MSSSALHNVSKEVRIKPRDIELIKIILKKVNSLVNDFGRIYSLIFKGGGCPNQDFLIL